MSGWVVSLAVVWGKSGHGNDKSNGGFFGITQSPKTHAVRRRRFWPQTLGLQTFSPANGVFFGMVPGGNQGGCLSLGTISGKAETLRKPQGGTRRQPVKGWRGRRSNPAHPHGHPVWRSGRSAPLPYPPDGYRQEYHICARHFNRLPRVVVSNERSSVLRFSGPCGWGILSFFRGCATVAALVSKMFFRPAPRVEAFITLSVGVRRLRSW